jgi:lactose/L-arabinose transport system permease protein
MRADKLIRYFLLALAALLSAFPLIWMLIAATHNNAGVLAGNLLPGKYLLSNFNELVSGQPIATAMWNSFKNAAALTVLSLLICSLAGYGFEIYHSKGKDRLMSVLLLTMMIPFAATMIPLFRMFSQMDLVSRTISVILPTISTPILIMLFRQSSRSFPHEIIEAARMDGLSEIRIFFKIFFPSMKSTYAAAMTITFMNSWNNYLWPRVILTKAQQITMPMLVANLTSGYVTQYGVLMLAVALSTLPTVVIFFLLQKSFTEGITGSLKG